MRHACLATLVMVLSGCEEPLALDDAGMEAAMGTIREAQSVEAPLEVAPQVIEGRPPLRDEGASDVPEGYVRVEPVARSGEFGHAVILVDKREERMVPIFIGGTEALSIQLRLERKKFTRPLTHDLLDSMLKELDVTMVRSQVDALEGGIYLGTVVVRRGDKTITFDARPSDAIALAIGNGVPIFVSERVLEAIPQDDFDDAKKRDRPDPVAL
jgi:uncharacterized protein